MYNHDTSCIYLLANLEDNNTYISHSIIQNQNSKTIKIQSQTEKKNDPCTKHCKTKQQKKRKKITKL